MPETVRTDEGKDYTSRHVLGTLTRDLLANLPGFTGHDVAQALRARKSFAQRRGEDDIETFGVELTAEQLQACCDDWCDAVYGERGHSGLDGATPNERARSWAEPRREVRDVRVLHDPADAGRLHVYLADGSFVCVAVCPALTGDDQGAIAAAMKAEWNDANREARDSGFRARDRSGAGETLEGAATPLPKRKTALAAAMQLYREEF